jgi:GDP-L-fucose synthase
MITKVLVTGGSGFLGKRLQKYKPEWIYPTSKQYNLMSYEQTLKMFEDIKPDAVVHLAARVGGVKDNNEHQGEFFYKNVFINTNVVEAARISGTKRVLASLSTCAFPETINSYPFSEQDLELGPPPISNLSYGYSKRLLHIQCLSYRKEYNLNYSTFCPSNIYGPEDHFQSVNSHFVAALANKIHKASNGDTIEMWGTGKPLRQQLFVDDLCKIIPELLYNHNTELPIIVAPDENLSIYDMCEIAKDISNKKINFVFNNNLDGQYRKDGSNKELKKILDNFVFTTFKDGFKKTLEYLEK